MITIKGVYENGSIRLLEDILLQEHQQLLITVIENETVVTKDTKNDALQQPVSVPDNLSAKRSEAYQDYLNTDK